jgi:hypothetical protein
MTYCCDAYIVVQLLVTDSSSNGHITIGSAFKKITAKSENSLFNVEFQNLVTFFFLCHQLPLF